MIFLSHSWKNKRVARQLVEALAMGRIPCWLDEQQLLLGDKLDDSIERAIADSDVYLYLVSKAANESPFCNKEIKYALSLKQTKKLKIISVRIAGNDDPMHPLLSDSLYSDLEPKSGGVARLVHELTNIKGHNNLPVSCRLSATVRLEEYRIVHTLVQARERLIDSGIEASFLLLNDDYDAMDYNYWSVYDTRFPPVHTKPEEHVRAAKTIDSIHKQSLSIIREAQLICTRFTNTDLSSRDHHYYDAGHERALHVMLHRLAWNTQYLVHLRDEKKCSQEFFDRRNLPDAFDGHCCEFVSNGKEVANARVPKYGHPLPRDMDSDLIAWGLTSPFSDMSRCEVGVAVGGEIAARFMAGTTATTQLPDPSSLTYGLA